MVPGSWGLRRAGFGFEQGGVGGRQRGLGVLCAPSFRSAGLSFTLPVQAPSLPHHPPASGGLRT